MRSHILYLDDIASEVSAVLVDVLSHLRNWWATGGDGDAVQISYGSLF